MMRKIRFALVASAASIAIAWSAQCQAADTQAAWEGFLTSTVTPPAACSTVGGTGKSDTHVSIYRPHIKSTDTPSFLSIVETRAAITFENTSEATHPQFSGTGTGNYTAFGINSRGKGFTYTGTYTGLTVTPNPVTATATAVTITGTLNNLFNTTGCNVTFEAVYVKRID